MVFALLNLSTSGAPPTDQDLGLEFLKTALMPTREEHQTVLCIYVEGGREIPKKGCKQGPYPPRDHVL